MDKQPEAEPAQDCTSLSELESAELDFEAVAVTTVGRDDSYITGHPMLLSAVCWVFGRQNWYDNHLAIAMHMLEAQLSAWHEL